MPLVFDISSDEEEGLEEGLKISDFDWIKDFLFTSDDEESDDSDDVVVICEKKAEVKSKSSTLAVKDVDGGGGGGDDDDDDDDCVVLEGDPENGVASVVEESTESDELVVVGEKGQVACRDYPHARHLCAKFPFSSTPHEKHCSQCHCYVCDSLAPCLKWGSGILSSDHCHANDKTEPWKIQRKHFKLGQSSPSPASTIYGTCLPAAHPSHNEFRPIDVINLSPNSVLPNQTSKSTAMHTLSSLNSIPQIQASRPTIMCALSPLLNSTQQNQVSRPMNIPVMSTSTNVTPPNSANNGRCRESGSTLMRNRYHPHTVSRPVLGVRSHAIQRERGSRVSSLRSQFPRSHVMSKGLGSGEEILTVNNPSHGPPGFNNRVNATQQHDKYHTATGFNNHTVASEMQSYSQPLPQSNDSQNFHQTYIQGNDDVLSIYATCLNNNQHGNEPQIRTQNENGNENITQCGTASQDTCQPKPHEESQSEAARKFSAFESSSMQNTSQNIDSGSVDQAPNVTKSGNQFTGSKSNEPVIESCRLPSSLADFENWLLDKDYVPMVNDVLPSDVSILSPDLDPVDMGLFYLGEVD